MRDRHRLQLALQSLHITRKSHGFTFGHAQFRHQLLHPVTLRLCVHPLWRHIVQTHGTRDACALRFRGPRARHRQSRFGIRHATPNGVRIGHPLLEPICLRHDGATTLARNLLRAADAIVAEHP